MNQDRGFTLIELLIVVAIVGIISAIAIPNLVRARVSANESQAIGDSRTLVSGLAAYATSNCGFYPMELTCATHEAGGRIGDCIPGYPDDAPQFLGADIAQGNNYERHGYERVYMGIGMGMNIPAGCDSMGRVAFCYQSQPISRNISGVRSFIVTSAGGIYQNVSGNNIPCMMGIIQVTDMVTPLT